MLNGTLKPAFVLWLAFLCCEAGAKPSLDFKSYAPGEWNVSVSNEYIKPDGNFTRSGNSYDSLPNGYSLIADELTLGSRYTFDGRNALSAAVTSAYQIADSPGDRKTSSSIGSFHVAYDFLLFKKPIDLVPELSIDYPFSTIDFSSNQMASSEGATAISAKLIASYSGELLQISPYAGYSYRDQGRSSLALYGIPAEWHSYRGFFLGASTEGFMTINFDRDTTDDLTRSNYFKNVTGGTKRYGAVNPSLLNASAWTGFEFSKAWKWTVGASSTVTGANTAHGLSAFIQIDYDYTPRRFQKEAPNEMQFRENMDDGVDQKLFDENKPQPSRKNSGTLKDELNKTQMQIELRPKSLKSNPTNRRGPR